MRFTRLSTVSLMTLVSFSVTVPVLAESMWVPRLGFPTQGPKLIYVEAQAESASAKMTKEQKREARETEKAQKEAQKAEKKAQKLAQKDKKETSETTPLTKEQQRKQAEAQKIARLKARLEAENDRVQNAPVDGTFYLFDMTQARLVFPSQASPQPASSDRLSGLPAYQVSFSEKTQPGVYDVAVKGSGHRSTGSFVVSDTAYWDAIAPTLQGIGKFHCPQETGVFRAVEQCFRVSVQDPAATLPDEATRQVQGGWYQPGVTEGMVKSTSDIARLTRLMIDLYALNPNSMKFLGLSGAFYAQSKYPDILDEATWGLEYIVTAQRADGSLPEGVHRSVNGEVETNTLLPSSANATALGVMTLAAASQVFQGEELSLSVKYLRAAEKGWRYLEAQKTPADPQLMALAADALWAATQQNHYGQARKAWLASTPQLEGQNQLFLSSLDGVNSVRNDDVVGWIAALRHAPQGQPPQEASQALSHWATNQFGYEPIPMARDLSFEMASAWVDPLQWMATKTGEVATRFGQKMTDSGVAGMRDHVDQARLSLKDSREAEAKKRLEKGVAQLSSNPMDRAYLAYALALLNREVAPVVDPKAPKPEAPNRYIEPVRRVKGFWRPEF